MSATSELDTRIENTERLLDVLAKVNQYQRLCREVERVRLAEATRTKDARAKADADYAEAVRRAEEARRAAIERREAEERQAVEAAEANRSAHEHLAEAFLSLPQWARAGLGEPQPAPAPAQLPLDDTDSDTDSDAGTVVAQFGATLAVVPATEPIECARCHQTKPATDFVSDLRGRVQTTCRACASTTTPDRPRPPPAASSSARRAQAPEGTRWCTAHADYHAEDKFTSWIDKQTGKRRFHSKCKEARTEAEAD